MFAATVVAGLVVVAGFVVVAGLVVVVEVAPATLVVDTAAGVLMTVAAPSPGVVAEVVAA